jgi:hypothetical protein
MIFVAPIMRLLFYRNLHKRTLRSELLRFNPECISAISWRDDNGVRFVLDQCALLDFDSVRSLKQESTGGHVATR